MAASNCHESRLVTLGAMPRWVWKTRPVAWLTKMLMTMWGAAKTGATVSGRSLRERRVRRARLVLCLVTLVAMNKHC